MDLGKEVAAVRNLVGKYHDRPMESGDACCVRLAEMLPGSGRYTVETADFAGYRKNGGQPVP